MVKKFGIFLLLLFIAACAPSENEETESVAEEPEKVEASESTEQENETDTSIELVEETEEENLEEENEQLKDLPPLPTSFNASADYPYIGKFSGGDIYSRSFNGEEEIQEVLNNIPKLDENSSEEEIENVKRYIYSLFKEDLNKLNVRLDQWDSMQLEDPSGESDEIRLKENYNVALLLDASGSMANLENGETRMKLAKASIQDFVEGLPEEANVSLWVYGHVGSGSAEDKERSCTTVEEIYPLGQYETKGFTEALHAFDPAGWTPMALAIEQVEEALAHADGKENTNIIYIVSDGVETCDGDPVKSIQSLSESNIDPVVNIIGYQVDNEGLAQLKEMAEVSNGRYVNARSQEDLTAEFQQTVDMSKLWREWHLDSINIVRELYYTTRNHLYDWYHGEKRKYYREHVNLQFAKAYLYDNKIISSEIASRFDDEFRDYHYTIADDAREQYDELYGINDEMFEEKLDEVKTRFEEAQE